VFSIKYNWIGASSVPSKEYRCGHCGHPLASDKAFLSIREGIANHPHNQTPRIYICHFCTRPTFFDDEGSKQWPGASYGNDVEHISDELVAKLYDEARQCTTTNSYTASVMCSRKLLMHIAVSKGAPSNQSFAQYVDYLATNNYIPVDSRGWVDVIRSKGNEANHEIALMTKEDAEELISFSEMLLKLIYEFPARIRPEGESPTPSTTPQAPAG
jgi:hypothetical protein